MTITRRDFLLSTTASAAGVALSALPRPALAQPPSITLKVQYAYSLTNEPIMTEIARRYCQLNPGVRVEFAAAAVDYSDLAQRALRAAVTGGLPDVAFHGLNYIDVLAQRDVIIPLTRLINSERGWNSLGYSQSLLDLGTARQEPYALPIEVAIKSIYYNLGLVKRAGGNPEALPQTWDQIVDLQKKIQRLGGDVSGMYADYYYDDNFCFHTLVQSQGGAVVTPDGRIAFESPEGLQALRWLRKFGEAGMVDMTVDQAYQSFSAGTMGILIASSSRVAQLTSNKDKSPEVRVSGFPRAANGRIPAGGAGAVICAKDPARQKAAWEFVKFATGPIGSATVVEASGYIPGNTRAASDPDLLGKFYAEHPARRAMFEEIPVLTRFASWPGRNALKIPTVIRDYLQKVLTLRSMPSQAMADMSEDVKQLL
jgi:multiple sugar transport system substrate-binding protein